MIPYLYTVTIPRAFAAILLACTIALALPGCAVEAAPAPEPAPAAQPATPALLPALAPIQSVEVCTTFRGAWALSAPRCPAGTSALRGECFVSGAHATLLASGLQGPDAWGCQATNTEGAFSICARVDCR